MTKANPLPDHAYLQALLAYDLNTGILTWRPRPPELFAHMSTYRLWNARFAGKPAGYLHTSGHINVDIGDQRTFAHRVIWKLMMGEDPPDEIDHRDTNKANNRWGNLRVSTHTQNSQNRALRSDSTSGFRGVGWHKGKGKWRVRIYINGKCKSLGYYDNIEPATAAYSAAAAKAYGEFYRAPQNVIVHIEEITTDPSFTSGAARTRRE